MVEVLRQRGIELEVLKQGTDTTTPTGRLVFDLLGAMDEFLRELIMEGTTEGLAAPPRMARAAASASTASAVSGGRV
uniref:recombinase family protein n=1 Tax=Actinomadura sp. CA-154981 TaxID=3240037 RepID=UPI003F4939FD